jgi:hypothetical protein
MKRAALFLVVVSAAATSAIAARAEVTPAQASDSAADSSIGLDAYGGFASFSTIGSGVLGGVEIAGHHEHLAWAAFGESAITGQGHADGAGATFGWRITGPDLSLEIDTVFGEHWYRHVGGTPGPSFSVYPASSGCSAFAGASGTSPYMGLRVGLLPTTRPGSRFLWGIWLNASEDLSRHSSVASTTVTCTNGIFSPPTVEPRSVDTTIGGWQLGATARIGWSSGF